MEQVMSSISLSAIAPELVLVACGLIVLMIQAVVGKRFRESYAYVSLLGVAAAAFLVLTRPGAFEAKIVEYSFCDMWVVDNFSRFFKLIFLIGTGLTVLVSIKYLDNEAMQHSEYYALMLLCTVGMMVMASAAELITIFLGVELMSISLYALAGYTRTRMLSNEAAIKYFILGSFASGFLIYGIALIYGTTGTSQIPAIAKYLAQAGPGAAVLVMGMALLIIGFGFKTASVPFHMWAPDVYEGAPAPVTGFMSAGPKAAAFAAFVRIFMEALPSLQTDWVMVIWIIAAFTMTAGNVIALVQENIKRMLAYSSIAHAGYVLVAFLAAGELGLTSILYYMLAYTFMNIGAFAVITMLAGAGETRVKVDDYRGVGYKHPVAALAMSLFLFSLAGIPPTGGFMGKFYIFSAAVKQGYIWLAIIGVLNSVVSVYYYLRVTVAMYMQPPEKPEDVPVASALSPALIVAVVISAYGVLSLGLFPSTYVAMVKESFLSFL
ncbi:MAG: NADH-quinone oxidoreductase subunit N [Desulfosoma sp.]